MICCLCAATKLEEAWSMVVTSLNKYDISCTLNQVCRGILVLFMTTYSCVQFVDLNCRALWNLFKIDQWHYFKLQMIHVIWCKYKIVVQVKRTITISTTGVTKEDPDAFDKAGYLLELLTTSNVPPSLVQTAHPLLALSYLITNELFYISSNDLK